MHMALVITPRSNVSMAPALKFLPRSRSGRAVQTRILRPSSGSTVPPALENQQSLTHWLSGSISTTNWARSFVSIVTTLLSAATRRYSAQWCTIWLPNILESNSDWQPQFETEIGSSRQQISYSNGRVYSSNLLLNFPLIVQLC
jgi:hypothetical protein